MKTVSDKLPAKRQFRNMSGRQRPTIVKTVVTVAVQLFKLLYLAPVVLIVLVVSKSRKSIAYLNSSIAYSRMLTVFSRLEMLHLSYTEPTQFLLAFGIKPDLQVTPDELADLAWDVIRKECALQRASRSFREVAKGHEDRARHLCHLAYRSTRMRGLVTDITPKKFKKWVNASWSKPAGPHGGIITASSLLKYTFDMVDGKLEFTPDGKIRPALMDCHDQVWCPEI